MPEVPPSISRLAIPDINFGYRDLHRQLLVIDSKATQALNAVNLLKQSGGSSTTPAPIPTTPPIPVYYGTVTSVGLSMPARFSVAPSVITEANIFVVTDVAQVKNTFLAGPLTGADATPTYRVIGTADLPLTGIAATTYGSASTSAVLTFDLTGRATAGSSVSIAIAASQITSGTLANARGGTGADTSSTGGTGQYVKQVSTGAAFTVGTIPTGDVPNLPASIITSGQLALARGGTNADLSATGGTSQYLKQSSVGGTVSVGVIATADLPQRKRSKSLTICPASTPVASTDEKTGIPLPYADDGTTSVTWTFTKLTFLINSATAPTGASGTATLKKNGTTILSSNLSIASGATPTNGFVSASTTSFNITTGVSGDIMTLSPGTIGASDYWSLTLEMSGTY